MSKLQAEKRENGPWALSCFLDSQQCEENDSLYPEDDAPIYDWAFEHGQLWITSNSWASWSVTDCEKAGEFYFGFEQVS